MALSIPPATIAQPEATPTVSSPPRAAPFLPRVRRHFAPSVAALLLLVPCPVRSQETVHDIKAEMLFNIARFVEWPSQRPRARGQLTFTILGEDDLAAVLANVLSTKTINGRDVFVRFVRRVEDVKDSQVLFIASSEEKRIPEVLEALRCHSVLTVADVAGFAALGGMVDFVQQDDKVRFEINLGSAERARLKISAKLLALAKIVAQAQ